MASKSFQKIGIIGFGEVGGIFGRGLARRGIDVATFDILFDEPASREAMLAKARACGVRACESVGDCLRQRELVISAVTASSAKEVAEQTASMLLAGQVFLDINSVSPETKSRIADYFEPSRGEFVEAAVMASVEPQRLKVPMLLGGRYAAELAPRLAAIGMNGKAVSDRVGIASATKMCRSVIVKGLEALVVESMFAARGYGAEDAVLASLASTYPDMGWDRDLPDYLISRVAEHGRRRAAELHEASQAVSDAGLEPHMARAAAARQEWLVGEIAALGIKPPAKKDFSWRELADAVRRRREIQQASVKRA